MELKMIIHVDRDITYFGVKTILLDNIGVGRCTGLSGNLTEMPIYLHVTILPRHFACKQIHDKHTDRPTCNVWVISTMKTSSIPPALLMPFWDPVFSLTISSLTRFNRSPVPRLRYSTIKTNYSPQ